MKSLRIALALCLVAILATAFCGSATATTWANQYKVATIDSGNYDLAMGENAAHVVYESGGNIYYAIGTPDTQSFNSILIGAGHAPSIASTESNEVHIFYSNGGMIYHASNADGWAPTQVMAGDYACIGISPDGPGQLLVEANVDGDSYTELYHTSNSGSGWTTPELLADGWYDSGSGNYYGQSSLAPTDTGYVYAYEAKNWGGRASWSSVSPTAVIPGLTSAGTSIDWNTGCQLSRNAIACEPQGVGYTFSSAGTVYLNYYSFEDGAWNGFQVIGSGGQASVSGGEAGGVAYIDGSTLKFWNGTISETVNFDGVDITGSNPVLFAGGNDDYILYKAGNADGSADLNFLMAESVPEPGSIMALASGLIGMCGLIARRRRG